MMLPRPSSCSSLLALRILLLLFSIPESFSLKVIGLKTITIFTTHDWLPMEPTIYFRCQGENITILPDVKETNHLYTFKGEESWQPLTQIQGKKCKRCGLYERDIVKSEDAFDEWEMCPEDFLNGTYVHFKKNEFNATFWVTYNETGSNMEDEDGSLGNHHLTTLVVVISTLVSFTVVGASIAGYKYWQKRRRDKEQAHFLKIIEEKDDTEEKDESEVKLSLEIIV